MSESPKTPGERAVWAAIFGAVYAQLRAFQRSHGGPQTPFNLVNDACDEAWGAIDELRRVADGGGDFAADVKAVIG